MSMFKRNGDPIFIPRGDDYEDDDEDFSILRDPTDSTDVTDLTDLTDVSYIPPMKNQQNEYTKMDVDISTQPFEMPKINQHTYDIMNEFNNEIDCTKAYSFKELSEVLKEIFSTKKKTKKVTDVKKRKPSSYNNYIKTRVNALKLEDPDRPRKEIMATAISEWRTFSQDQKDTYK